MLWRGSFLHPGGGSLLPGLLCSACLSTDSPPLPEAAGCLAFLCNLASCGWVVLSLCPALETRARFRGVRANAAHQLGTCRCDLRILTKGCDCRRTGGQGWRRTTEGQLGWTRLCLRGERPPRPHPDSRPALPERSRRHQALAIVSAFPTGSGAGARAGAGRPGPAFPEPPLFLCVRAWAAWLGGALFGAGPH